MGYLDGDTITVDAVLTKKGREMISAGKQLNISSFTLSDTGVDYTLWNTNHPRGSSFYGEAIENLPMYEASVHSQYALRNKLITLNKDTIAMPVLELTPDPTTQYVFDSRTPVDFTATIVGFSGGQGGCQLLVQDKNVVTANGTQVDVTGNALSFIYEQNIPQAALYEMRGGGPSYTFKITPQTIRDVNNATTNLTFIEVATGAYVSIEVKVNFNKDTRQTIASTSVQGQ